MQDRTALKCELKYKHCEAHLYSVEQLQTCSTSRWGGISLAEPAKLRIC